MASSLYISIRGDYSEFEADLRRVRGIARQNGNAISQALGNSIRPTQAVNNLRRLTEAIRDVGAAGLTRGTQAQIQGLQELAHFAGVSERQMRSLTRAMQETARQNNLTRSLAELQRQTGYTERQMAVLRIRMGDVRGGLLAYAKSFVTAAKAMGIFVAGIAAMGKGVTDAVIRIEATQKAFASITGSTETAKEELAFIRGEADRLGLEYVSTAEAAKTFYAAATPTSLKGKAREIFSAFSEAGTALSLSGEQMNGIFLALGQMISKGKVQAEELRGQVGERLPGAFQLAAQSMGMTTAELDKFMADGKLTAEDLLPKMARALHDEFGQAAQDAAYGTQQAVNRLTTAWENFKTSLDGEFCVTVIEGITWVVNKLGAALASVNNAVRMSLEAAKGGISYTDIFMDPEKHFNIPNLTRLRNEAMDKYKSMKAERDNPNKGFFYSVPSEKALEEQYALVQHYNTEIARINTQAAKEQRQQELQAKKEQRRIQQEHDSQRLALQKSADDAYAKAMQNNTAFRLAELKKEEDAKIAAQEAAEMSEERRQKRITDIQAEYAKKRQELQDRENRQGSSGAGRRASSSSAGKDISQLESQINRLRMSGAEFKEWELTNVTLPRMLKDFPGATDKVIEFAEAQRKAFADEAAKEAEEENKKQMSERARLLKELADLSGDTNMGQEAQNMLLEQQAQAYRDTLGPEMQAYIDKWKELQQLRNSESFTDKIKVGFNDAYKNAMDVGGNLVNAASGWADSIGSAFADMASGGKASFSDLAKSIVSDLAKMTAKTLIYAMVAKAAGLLKNFFAPSVSTDLGAMEAATPDAIFAAGGWANGGAFAGGSLSRYSNSIVTRPTLFSYGSSLKKFASGAGLMGEAGPEAIMPLRRHNGRLGVDASGSSPRVNLVINNMAGAQIETEQRRNADGSYDIEASILSSVNRDLSRRGGQLNRTMRNQWGGRSIVTQR